MHIFFTYLYDSLWKMLILNPTETIRTNYCYHDFAYLVLQINAPMPQFFQWAHFIVPINILISIPVWERYAAPLPETRQ